MTPKRYITGPQGRRTHPVLWCAAVICIVLAAVVIVAGIAVFGGYIAIHPRIPFFAVVSATLDTFRYDYTGLLVAQITITIRAENDNLKARASFQNMSLGLGFGGMEIARLASGPFDVEKNGFKEFHYVVGPEPVGIGLEMMGLASSMLRQDEVVFNLQGNTRARWHVGPFGSVKYWCHLNCQLHFHPRKRTFSNSNRCSSRPK